MSICSTNSHIYHWYFSDISHVSINSFKFLKYTIILRISLDESCYILVMDFYNIDLSFRIEWFYNDIRSFYNIWSVIQSICRLFFFSYRSLKITSVYPILMISNDNISEYILIDIGSSYISLDTNPFSYETWILSTISNI